MKTDVLPSPDISDEVFTIHAYSEDGDDAGIGDILKFVLALCEAFDVIAKALTGLAFTS
jgi:hypothetical protein